VISHKLGLDRFSGLYLFATFVLIFGLWTPHLFFAMATVYSVASQQAIVGMLALAVLVPLATGAFDLSVGANINLVTVLVCVVQTQHGWPMWLSIVAGVSVGALVGLVNGFVVVKLRVNSFIATLGTSTLITAVQLIVDGGTQPNPPTSTAWTNLTQYQVFGFQIVVVYLVVLALIIWWLLEWTPAGRYMYAIGSNAEAARLSGVAVGKWTWIALTVGGGITGIAGVLYASLSGPSLSFGASLLLPAFAAVYLGSTQLKPGRLNVWGALLAIYVLATGVQGLQFVTDVQWLSPMFNGLALILAVAVAGERGRQVSRRRRRAAVTQTPESSSSTEPRTVANAHELQQLHAGGPAQ
jgi:ribose transport system permease protein